MCLIASRCGEGGGVGAEWRLRWRCNNSCSSCTCLFSIACTCGPTKSYGVGQRVGCTCCLPIYSIYGLNWARLLPQLQVQVEGRDLGGLAGGWCGKREKNDGCESNRTEPSLPTKRRCNWSWIKACRIVGSWLTIIQQFDWTPPFCCCTPTPTPLPTRASRLFLVSVCQLSVDKQIRLNAIQFLFKLFT